MPGMPCLPYPCLLRNVRRHLLPGQSLVTGRTLWQVARTVRELDESTCSRRTPRGAACCASGKDAGRTITRNAAIGRRAVACTNFLKWWTTVEAKFKPKHEPYDEPRIFHDSFETYDFEPSKDEREAFRNHRFAQGRLRWIKKLMEKWKDQEAREWNERMQKRLAEITAAVISARRFCIRSYHSRASWSFHFSISFFIQRRRPCANRWLRNASRSSLLGSKS